MKHVLITGASGGIGAACVRAFASAGYRVFGQYCTDENSAEQLKNETGVRMIRADLTDPAQVKRLFEQTETPIDVLINNAGAASFGMLADTDEETWGKTLDVNLSAAYRVTKEALADMMWHEGTIINVSSIWGQCGGACESAYSAAKAGLIGLTKALAKEYVNLTVNCICPGVIDTKMNDHLSKEEKEALRAEIPAGRFGRPEEVAALALFLASENARYITGQVIAVNGGLYM